MKKAFIYIIRNTKNNKVYIGQTKVNLETRWKEHVRHAKYGRQLINRAMKKHGIENFQMELIEECTVNDVDSREIFYKKKYNATNLKLGYNISLGGETPKLKRPCYDRNDALKLYKERKSLDYVSKLFCVTRYILRQDFEKGGVSIRDRYFYNRKFNRIPEQEILEKLNKKLSMRKAAKALNIPYSTFRKACKNYNIEYNSSTSVRHPEKDENVC